MTVFYVTFSMPFYFKSLEDDQKKNDKTQLEKQNPGVSYTLQYELMPNGMVYTADVTCWGPVAQVTTQANNYTFKTIRHKDYNWVIFSIGHKANVEKKNIIDMINNEISICISPSKTEATKGKKEKKKKKEQKKKKGKKEKGKQDEEDTEKNDEMQLTENESLILWLNEALTKPDHPLPNDENDTILQEKETKSIGFMGNPYRKHWQSILKSMTDLYDKYLEEQNKLKELQMVQEEQKDDTEGNKNKDKSEKNNKSKNNAKNEGKPDKVKKDKGKEEKKGKNKREKKGKSSKTNQKSINTQLQTKYLIAGKDVIEGYISTNDQNQPYAATLLTADGLLVEKDFIDMNPLVIKFKSIKNIPLESLKKAKIEKIYIKYKILNESFIETETWEVKNESLSIDHVKIIPTDKMNALELLECLQTSYLLVAILGMKSGDKQIIHKKSEIDTVVKVKGKKSASRQNLENIPLQNQKHKTLALAKCDLSNLLDKQAFLEEELPLFSNESFSIRLMRKLEVMIQHLDDMNDEIILNLSSTEIFLSFAVPLQENQGTLKLAGKMHYNRLYVTFHDCSIAQSVVKRVKSLNLRSILKTKNSGTPYKEMPKEEQKFLTGFLVYDTKDVLLYVEGIYGIISSFYEELLQLPQCSQDIIFDDSLVFNKRLYDKFIVTGGFHSVNLKNTLETLLSIEESVKKEEQVRPWKETIRSLSEIMKTEDMKRACREELFPTPTELISLDIKYGVPQRNV